MTVCAPQHQSSLILASIYVVAALSAMAGCAQKGRPGGGPPDTTPPTVIATLPVSGAVRVDRSAVITVEFSEPIDPGSITRNLFVFPRRQGVPEVRWSKGGRVARLSWDDTLRAKATYRVTIGTKVRDRHNIPFAGAYTFAFATGAVIDSGRIVGRLHALDPDAGDLSRFDIFAYDLAHAPDTFWLTEPDYLTPVARGGETEAAGSFDLPYLRPGRYRIVAVVDENRNRRWDAEESFGLALRDAVLDRGASADTVVLFARLSDPTAFRLEGCTGSAATGLTLTFSHAIDTASWMGAQFTVTDVETGDTLTAEAMRPSLRRPSLVSVRSEMFRAQRIYRVVVTGLRDEEGASLPDSASCRALLREAGDTTGPFVVWTHWPGTRKGKSPRDHLILEFDEPVDTLRAAAGFAVTDTGRVPIPGELRWLNAQRFAFTPEGSWPETPKVMLTLDSAGLVDLRGNPAPAQAFAWDFVPLTASGMGAVEGRIEIADSAWWGSSCRLRVRELRGVRRVEREFNVPGPFTFDLPAGDWILSGFVDLDGDGRPDPGALDPYRIPEPQMVQGDTLAVRARFTLEDVVVRFQ